MDMRIQNYDERRGWADTEPGWFEYEITVSEKGMSETYEEVLDWLYNRIDKCERHARWRIVRGHIFLKFRYERDVILCKLSF
jgi:P2-related tail formation protein